VHEQTGRLFRNTETNRNIARGKALGACGHLKNDEKGLSDTELDFMEKCVGGSRLLMRANITCTREIFPDLRFSMTAFAALKIIVPFDLRQVLPAISIRFKPIGEL